MTVIVLFRLLVGLIGIRVVGWALGGLPQSYRKDIGDRMALAVHSDPEFQAALESWLR